jgi:hypothetical protein
MVPDHPPGHSLSCRRSRARRAGVGAGRQVRLVTGTVVTGTRRAAGPREIVVPGADPGLAVITGTAREARRAAGSAVLHRRPARRPGRASAEPAPTRWSRLRAATWRCSAPAGVDHPDLGRQRRTRRLRRPHDRRAAGGARRAGAGGWPVSETVDTTEAGTEPSTMPAPARWGRARSPNRSRR